ncbi:hypothetical protein DFS34DRAFT_591609 [Phlyctochytrium arcticum]|nr:hypothetical protein DFS34DRAFT_591609 [Phlyctochytrium arcticum]
MITSNIALSGVDSTTTTLLTDNFTTAPTGTLTGTAAYDSTNKYVVLQQNNQTFSNGSLTYTIPILVTYGTLQCDLLYSLFPNDEGISVNLGGYIALFSGYFNYTRLYSPDGTFTETPASLPRDIFATIKMKVVYDTIQLFVNNVLVSTKSNDTGKIPPSTNVELLVFGQSGGFASQKVIDNISLVQNSNATEVIKFAPYNGKVTSQVLCQDDGLYDSSLIFASSTGPTGTLQGQMKIAPTGVYLANNKLVASQEYVNTQISATPLSNYTLLSTYNTRQTEINNRFTPIKTRQSQLKALSNLDTIDLATSVVTSIPPVNKVNTSTLQPLITSGNAASVITTLGLPSTSTSGIVEWANVTSKPVFDSLSLKNTVDLSTSEAIGNLPWNRISGTPTYVLQSVYDTRINQLGSLSNKSVIDLASSDVRGILPITKVNVSSLQTNTNFTGNLNVSSSIFGGNTPILSLAGGGGSGNSCGINISPWAGRPQGLSCKILAVDDNIGGAKLSFQASSGAASLTEFLSGNSSSVILPLTTDSTSITTGALQIKGGVSITKDVFLGGGTPNIPNAGFSQITLGNMYICCTPLHTNGDLHFFDTITNHRYIGWYGATHTLSLGPIGGVGMVQSHDMIDVGFNAVTPSYIRSNSTDNVLCIKNRNANGYSAINFLNTTESVYSTIGIGCTGTASPYKDGSYIYSPTGLYLDAPDGGKLTRPVVTNMWDNASTGQNATIPLAFSKTFTTTRTTQTYNGCFQVYSNADNTGVTLSCRIDGNVVKTLYFFFNHTGVILRLPFDFFTTGLALGSHTFTLTWTGSPLSFDANCRIDLQMLEY